MKKKIQHLSSATVKEIHDQFHALGNALSTMYNPVEWIEDLHNQVKNSQNDPQKQEALEELLKVIEKYVPAFQAKLEESVKITRDIKTKIYGHIDQYKDEVQ